MHESLGSNPTLSSFVKTNRTFLMNFYCQTKPTILGFLIGGLIASQNGFAIEASNTLKDVAFPLSQKSTISSGYGFRADPFTGEYQNHSGIDLPAHFGSAILAASNGRVKFTGYLPRYGNLVEIDHGQGYITRYGHADRILVNVGDTVMASQMIATVGTTGRTTGPHLHFEVSHNQTAMDPRAFLSGEGVGFLNLPTLTPAASVQRVAQYQVPRQTTYQIPKPSVSGSIYSNKKLAANSDEIKPRIIYVSNR
jgi:murein DD-endopeptidase MepM/ murein hydrolase activator NlpD